MGNMGGFGGRDMSSVGRMGGEEVSLLSSYDIHNKMFTMSVNSKMPVYVTVTGNMNVR